MWKQKWEQFWVRSHAYYYSTWLIRCSCVGVCHIVSVRGHQPRLLKREVTQNKDSDWNWIVDTQLKSFDGATFTLRCWNNKQDFTKRTRLSRMLWPELAMPKHGIPVRALPLLILYSNLFGRKTYRRLCVFRHANKPTLSVRGSLNA